MSSQTYQFLPSFLFRPLMLGAINLAEASELLDLWLLLGQPETFKPECPRLRQAAARMSLLEREVSATVH